MFEVRETGNPEVPLYFGEGLRRSLGNAAGCAGGRQMGCAGFKQLSAAALPTFPTSPPSAPLATL